jgi:soluble lytic murein transglycosylase-like protein
MLGIAALCGFAAGSALAQTPAPPVAATAVEASPAATNAIPASDYKNSLVELSTIYQSQVEKLEKQNAQMKDLFKDGLIARIEMDGSDKALAEARTKIEEIAKQIEEAGKPAPQPVSPNETVASLNQSWTTGNARVDGLIRFYGNQHGVDPYLIFCLMSQESGFTRTAISNKGAQGLMQLMPGTAARYGVTNPYDMAQNIAGGTRYLRDLLKMFNGRVDLALAGYNAGEGAVMKYGYTIPPYEETRNYVKLITKRYGRVSVAPRATTAKPSGE